MYLSEYKEYTHKFDLFVTFPHDIQQGLKLEDAFKILLGDQFEGDPYTQEHFEVDGQRGWAFFPEYDGEEYPEYEQDIAITEYLRDRILHLVCDPYLEGVEILNNVVVECTYHHDNPNDYR
jgi:hypothetical protein